MSGDLPLRQPGERRPALLWIPGAFLITLAGLWWVGALQQSFSSTFLPHGFCFNWNSHLVWIHVSSDLIIATSYLSISATLAVLVARARGTIPFSWLFLAFGAFIVACGMTHLMEVVTLWLPYYWLSGNIKVFTAIASLSTAVALPPMVPKILGMLHAAELSEQHRGQLEAAQMVLQGELATQGETLEKLAVDIAARNRELDYSRTHLYAVLKSIGDGVIVTDPKGHVTFLNVVAETLTGWSSEQAMGLELGAVFQLIDAVTGQRLESPVDQVKRTRSIVSLPSHTLLLARDGSEISIDDSGAPIFDARGQLTGVILIFRDISDRRRAEETRLLLASIVDSSQDAIISRDLNGIITTWNRGAEILYGYSAPEVVGKMLEIILPEVAGEKVLAEEVAAFKDGQRHVESKRRTRDGRIIDVALTMSPVFNYSGREVGISTIGRDITNQKLAEEALRTSEKLAAAGRLASSIAHEINNPLEAVMNLLYLIEADAEAQGKISEYASKAQEEMRHVAHITRQTLAFYRDSTRPVRIDLREVVDSLFEIFQRDMREKSISATVIMDPGLFIVGFPGELRQVLANLIRNAIEAMPPGGQLQVRGARVDSKYVQVIVRDSGPGISPGIQSRIFEPFFTTKGENGTGLGLWVTQGIVHKHAGTITVASPPEGGETGAEFIVVLPQRAFPTGE